MNKHYDIWNNKELLSTAVESTSSYSEVLRFLGISIQGHNINTLKRKLQQYNINTNHFSNVSYTPKTEIPNEQLLVANSTSRRSIVKRRILKQNLIPYQCHKCQLGPNWHDAPLTLQLEHINGIHNDHRLENLCFLCPNCHSQTNTFAGRKNKKRTTIKTTNQQQDEYLKKQNEYINDLTTSDIDFSKIGWVKEAAIIINQQPQKVHLWMKRFMPEFYENCCYKRKSRV